VNSRCDIQNLHGGGNASTNGVERLPHVHGNNAEPRQHNTLAVEARLARFSRRPIGVIAIPPAVFLMSLRSNVITFEMGLVHAICEQPSRSANMELRWLTADVIVISTARRWPKSAGADCAIASRRRAKSDQGLGQR
jgi:hypothetical protein